MRLWCARDKKLDSPSYITARPPRQGASKVEVLDAPEPLDYDMVDSHCAPPGPSLTSFNTARVRWMDDKHSREATRELVRVVAGQWCGGSAERFPFVRSFRLFLMNPG